MRLRRFLDKLEEEGKLTRISREVSHEYEVANVLHANGERPTLFERVSGFDMPVFGGIVSSRELVAEGLGTTREDILPRLVSALRDPRPPSTVNDAPCQEVVVKEPDLDTLPLLLHLPGDGGRYTTTSICIIKDPDTGRNASYHRLMQRDRDRFTARLIPQRQTRTTWEKATDDIEVAVCLGSSTAMLVAASLGPPSGVDELSVANALEETPVVKCVTKDLDVPAHTEIVLEGRITHDRDDEGPFVDLTETRDIQRQEPVLVVDCITHRRDPLYQCLLPGRLEHKTLMGMPKEPTIYESVSKVTDCRNVFVTPGGGSWLHGVVQVSKRRPDDGVKAIHAAFEGHRSMKHVLVVDADVDIYDPDALEWALATRFQAHRDAVILPDQPSSSLDPSAEHQPGEKARTTKVGLDATIPEGVDPAHYERVRYKDIDLADYR